MLELRSEGVGVATETLFWPEVGGLAEGEERGHGRYTLSELEREEAYKKGRGQDGQEVELGRRRGDGLD